MREQYPASPPARKPAQPQPPPGVTGNVRCLDCARARRQGRDHGCLVHVAEDVFP